MRSSAAPALAALVRRIGDFHDAEDAVQEAMAMAAQQWPAAGIPENPTGWIVTVATRRAIDALRSEAARRERERRVAVWDAEAPDVRHVDDTLSLYLLCCHPSLTRPAQVALTLRAVGGLTTREIARGLLLSEATVAQRITRAKRTLRDDGARFVMPAPEQMPARVAAVLDVLGVIHTESHTAAEGESITRPGLGSDAMRLARELLDRTEPDAPWRGELVGLVALMLFTDARAPARVSDAGDLIALADQDRRLWRADLIADGDRMLTDALQRHAIGPFQLKAAIAGVHAAASTWDDTDWHELLHLYDLLRVLDPSPIVELGRLVAYGRVAGPDAALAALDALTPPAPVARTAAVRAHLLESAGLDAAEVYRDAAAHARNGAERRWLEERASRP